MTISMISTRESIETIDLAPWESDKDLKEKFWRISQGLRIIKFSLYFRLI